MNPMMTEGKHRKYLIVAIILTFGVIYVALVKIVGGWNKAADRAGRKCLPECHNFTSIVIHMKNAKEERKLNVDRLRQSLGNIEFRVMDAVDGTTVDENDLRMYDPLFQIRHLNRREYKGGEYGCYLSHFMIIKTIYEANIGGYSLIFEDDANITTSNFQEDVAKIALSVEDFDILFLGNLNENHGEQYKDNIFHVHRDSPMYGTHAYMIKNCNADRVYHSLLTMHKAIDNQYKELIDSEILKGYVIFPSMVSQYEFSSGIGPHVI